MQPRTHYALTAADETRFWDSVDVLDGHWWWMPKTPQMILADGSWANPGRVAFQIAGRTIPDGHNVRYLCPMKACINPEHHSTYSRKGGPWNYVARPGVKKSRQKVDDPGGE